MNLALLNLLERVLGQGTKANNNNYKFICPFHVSDPPGKKKLEINLENQQWSCWVCGNTNSSKGKSIKSLFKKMGIIDIHGDELKLISPSTTITSGDVNVSLGLPKEFLSFESKPKDSLQLIQFKQAYTYLKNRKLTKVDILKYNIGVCLEGKYENRIIIPSYDANGKLNYFAARDFTDVHPEKYKNPPIKSKNIIAMELYINWNLPIILCEGFLDCITFKRNCIPLIGKNISEALYKKIVTSQVQQIYICLDKDAINDSLKYCEELMKMGKQTYLVELDEKDINKIGFKKFLNIIEKTPALTFQDLVIKKLNK